MTLCIAGMGWVTPLGDTIPQVWDELIARKTPEAEILRDPVAPKTYVAFRVPTHVTSNLPAHPRLRRASAISRFAAAAGLAALADAKLAVNASPPPQIALVFAIANGGVIYTKRFYHDIVTSGAEAASPLLFPETVFNAAASHLAAILGIAGATYTIVGDGAVGLLAIKMAEDLMADPSVDYVLVVAAEEADWLLCDAYKSWRLLRSSPPIEPFQKPPKGTILSEGGGAVLLGREGALRIEKSFAAPHYARRAQVKERVKDALEHVATATTGAVVSSANGTFIDEAEAVALSTILPGAILYTPKPSLGESVAAAGIWQVIIAAEALRRQQLPSPSGPDEKGRLESDKSANWKEIAVISCGLNQQVAAARLAISFSSSNG